MNDLQKFQSDIGYTFKNESLLRQALTHTSYANENKQKHIGHNERLEFLGDSVLSITVSEELYRRFPELPEGELTRIRASLVCEKTLFILAKEAGFGDVLFLGKGEDMSGGRNRPSVMSDAFEAVIAAIFLDGGMENAKRFILPRIEAHLENHLTGMPRDYKSELQEIVQQNPDERISYVLTNESGPDHSKTFTVEVHINSNRVGTGVAPSKKEAEQRAAKEALRLLGK